MAQNRRASPPDDPPARRTDRGAKAEQLRADIDAGRTGDKTDHPDPAAAPLGTDAEAGGTPAGQEIGPEPASPAAPGRAPGERREGALPPDAARPWLVALVVAIVVIAGFIWFFAAM